MNSIPLDCHRFEFSFPRLDTEVQVEVSAGEVVIRSNRDSFSADRKSFFIHELAAEGFIPDAFLWYSPQGVRPGGHSVTWTVDPTLIAGSEATASRSRLLYLQALSYSALAMALFLGLLFTGNLGNVRVGLSPAERHDPIVLRDHG